MSKLGEGVGIWNTSSSTKVDIVIRKTRFSQGDCANSRNEISLRESVESNHKLIEIEYYCSCSSDLPLQFLFIRFKNMQWGFVRLRSLT